MAETIKKSLYNGTININFYPGKHTYKLDGERTYLISVTAVTGLLDKSRPLMIWATRLTGSFMKQYLEANAGQKFSAEELYPVIDEAIEQHNVKKVQAATIGDVVHKFAEDFANWKIGNSECPTIPKKTDEITDEQYAAIRNAIGQFMDWVKANKVEFEEAERFVYSKKYGFCGKTDIRCKINGKRYIGDWKTSNGIYDEYRYQGCAYLGAYEEETGDKLDGVIIIPFSKESGVMSDPEIIDRKLFVKIYKAFVNLYKVKKWQKEMDKLTGKWAYSK